MKLKMNKEIYLSTFIIVVCAWLYNSAQSFPMVARRYPQGLLVIIGVLAVIEMITKTFAISRLTETIEQVAKKSITPFIRAVTVGALCLMYVFMVGNLGYFSSTIIFGFVFMFYLGLRRPTTLISVVLGMNLFIYLLFVVLLRVPMPQGLLF